jgi:hypothetical protein
MPAAVGLEWSKEDMARLMAQMERAREVLGKSMAASVQMAMKAVLQSVAKSTRVSEPFRAYKQVGVSRSGKNKVWEVTTKYRTPMRKGKALRRSWQGDWRKQLIYAPTEAQLKRRPAVIVAMSGLAAESWKQVLSRSLLEKTKAELKGSRKARNTRIMRKAARRWVSVDKNLRSHNPYMRISNSLKYIRQALQGGEQSINTAMRRAADGMAHRIDETLKQKVKAAK